MIAFIIINVNLYRTFYQTYWGYRYRYTGIVNYSTYRTIGHLSLEHVDWEGTETFRRYQRASTTDSDEEIGPCVHLWT